MVASKLVQKEAVAAALKEGHRDGHWEDLVEDWLHVAGKGEEVISTVVTKFPAGATGGWEGNS